MAKIDCVLLQVISSFFGPTNDLKKDKIRNDTNPSPNPTQLQPKCDVTNVTKPARDDKRQTPTTAMTRDRTGTPGKLILVFPQDFVKLTFLWTVEQRISDWEELITRNKVVLRRVP